MSELPRVLASPRRHAPPVVCAPASWRCMAAVGAFGASFYGVSRLPSMHDMTGYLDDHGNLASKRILVPLCGASNDLAWLAEKGFAVVGVEFVAESIAKMYTGDAAIKMVDKGITIGPFRVWAPEQPTPTNNLSVLAGNMFDATPSVAGTCTCPQKRGRELSRAAVVVSSLLPTPCRGCATAPHVVVSTVGGVWDTASLVALEPSDRKQYAKTISDLVVPHGRVLLSVLRYDQSASAGPPFSVTSDDIAALYGREFDIVLLESTPTVVGGGKVPAFMETYTLTKK